MRPLRSAMALGVTTLVLTGCGADAEPKFEASPSPMPTSASSSPDQPEPWEEKTPDGAIAFAEHWTATFSEAFQSGRTDELRTLGRANCESCKFLIRTVDDIYKTGGSADGDAWRFTDAAATQPSDDGDLITVTGIMHIPPLTIRQGSGEVEREPEVRTRFNFFLSWSGGWTIERLVRQS